MLMLAVPALTQVAVKTRVTVLPPEIVEGLLPDGATEKADRLVLLWITVIGSAAALGLETLAVIV